MYVNKYVNLSRENGVIFLERLKEEAKVIFDFFFQIQSNKITFYKLPNILTLLPIQ